MPQKKKSTTENIPELKGINKSHQIRLALGLILLFIGIYLCFIILSYFFTWQHDQDMLVTSGSINDFLKNNKLPVANWGGAMGAAISHALVYKGFGIASFAIGAWVTSIAVNIIYGNRKFTAIRYLRWTAILLLLLAPLLAYLLPNNPFPFGGEVGNAAIDFSNHLFGKAGTGMALACLGLFLGSVVFALDLRPMIRRAKKTAVAVGAGVINMKEEMGEKLTDWKNGKTVASSLEIDESVLNAQKEQADPITTINDEIANKVYSIVQHEKEALATEQTEVPINNEAAEEDEEETAYNNWLEQIKSETIVEAQAQNDIQDNAIIAPSTEINATTNGDTKDLSFEVKVAKEDDVNKKILHGAHISIQDDEPYDPEDDLPDYRFPTLDLLEERGQDVIAHDKAELEKNKNQIISTLKSFGIEISKISAIVGPTVTLYEIIPAEGVRISKIRNLEDDIALNLAALGIRIIAPIPGRGTIGIEVPNANKQIVSMKTLLASEKFVHSKMSLPIALGKKIDNENYIVDLASMPHLLVAGATGQGKSVGINAILISLLYKKHPSQLKFVMVDPKIVELSIYRKIEKHYLAKLPNEEEAIITDTKKVINTLNSLCIEMDNRYELLKEANTRNIKEYNDKFVKRRLNPQNGHKYLPFIVLVIDEFADLIMTAGKEIEMPIARLAQKARAVGMHIIVATQRPSVNVITGVIKANFPARIAFKVSSKIDSRTILDSGGAEQLIGRGDMLISHGSELIRLQCAFVDTPEVENIVNFVGEQRGYATAFELPEYESDEESEKIVDLTNKDKLFEECARMVVQTGNGSTSNLQRRLNLGYNRAGRIMDQLEAAGIVGPASGSKPRDVLVKTEHDLMQYLESL